MRYPMLLFLGIGLSFCLHVDWVTTDIQGLHSWRQSQTMWNIRNFVRHDGSILNPRANVFNGDNDNLYRYEFPIFQWLIAMIQRLVGESIVLVRVFVFLIGALGMIGMYLLLRQVLQDGFVALAGAYLFH